MFGFPQTYGPAPMGTSQRGPPPMGRVLRPYDRESRTAAWRQDPEGAAVRAIEDATWAEAEDKAYFDEAEYDIWKRQATQDLADFEKGVRARARSANHFTVTSAATMLTTKRQRTKKQAPTAVVQKKKGRGTFPMVLQAPLASDAHEPADAGERMVHQKGPALYETVRRWETADVPLQWVQVSTVADEVEKMLVEQISTAEAAAASTETPASLPYGMLSVKGLVADMKTMEHKQSVAEERVARAKLFAEGLFPNYLDLAELKSDKETWYRLSRALEAYVLYASGLRSDAPLLP